MRVPWSGLLKLMLLVGVLVGAVLGGAWAITHYADKRQEEESAEGTDDAAQSPGGATRASSSAGFAAGSEPIPPGEAGPFAISEFIGEVNDYGYAAATVSSALVIYRAVVPGKECVEGRAERCTQWLAALRPRQADAVARSVRLFESDTPSGARLEDVAGGLKRFAIVGREGIYEGDTRRLLFKMLDEHGRHINGASLVPDDVLSYGGAVTHVGKDRFLACWSGPPRARGTGLRDDLRVWCRLLGSNGRAQERVEATKGLKKGRFLVPALAWRGDRGLIAWVRNETLEVRSVSVDGLDKKAQPVAISADGQAVPKTPLLVAGHGGYLVIWQAPNGRLQLRRLDKNGEPEGAIAGVHETLARYVFPDGAAALPEGFMLSVRSGGGSRVLLISPTGQGIREIPRKKGASRLLFDGISALHVYVEPAFRLKWRLAASLIRRK